jgi:hypothetical protein
MTWAVGTQLRSSTAGKLPHGKASPCRQKNNSHVGEGLGRSPGKGARRLCRGGSERCWRFRPAWF